MDGTYRYGGLPNGSVYILNSLFKEKIAKLNKQQLSIFRDSTKEKSVLNRLAKEYFKNVEKVEWQKFVLEKNLLYQWHDALKEVKNVDDLVKKLTKNYLDIKFSSISKVKKGLEEEGVLLFD